MMLSLPDIWQLLGAVMRPNSAKVESQRIKKKRLLVVDDPAKSPLPTVKLLVALVIVGIFIWLAYEFR